MSFNAQNYLRDYSDAEFYSIVDCLKTHKALPKDSFLREVPFFNFDAITKESLVKGLFEVSSSNTDLYNDLLKNILALDDNENNGSEDKENMMTFAQLIFYKVLPCPDANCCGRPREIVTHNQYRDNEFECPFYHHERDRRRIAITQNIEADFEYKANYFEEGRSQADRTKYSLNYFESMFHPLYYKMFRCKREFCNSCHYCPFYHNEQEKKNWDKMFNGILNKDRITYVKDKQKYLESTSQPSSENSSPIKPYNREERFQHKRNRNNNGRYQKSPQSSGINYNGNMYQANNEGKRGTYNKKNFDGKRKGSDDFNNGNQVPLGMFSMTPQFYGYRAC